MYNNGAYGYMQNDSQFGSMDQMGAQFNSYDFQGASAFPPPAPSFDVGISCPAPPGMSEGWIPPMSIQPEENLEDRLKREGEFDDIIV